MHLKIRDDCLTPASQTPVLGWWGMHPVIPLDPPLASSYASQSQAVEDSVNCQWRKWRETGNRVPRGGGVRVKLADSHAAGTAAVASA